MSAVLAETPSQTAHRIGEARRAFKGFVLEYGPQDSAQAALDEFRIAGLDREPGMPADVAIMVAPRGTGKTMAVKALSRKLGDTLDGPGPRRILRVEISTEGTAESVPVSILKALHMPKPSSGKPAFRWERAIQAIREAGVEVVVFDELNRAARRATMSAPIVNSIREMIIDEGVASVVFVGNEDAKAVLKTCPDVAERIEDRITLEPLDWFDIGDKKIIIDLLEQLDGQLEAAKIFKTKSGLAELKTAENLATASRGRIRTIMLVVKRAMVLALRDGAARISWDDLRDAVADLPLAAGLIKTNPFDAR